MLCGVVNVFDSATTLPAKSSCRLMPLPGLVASAVTEIWLVTLGTSNGPFCVALSQECLLKVPSKGWAVGGGGTAGAAAWANSGPASSCASCCTLLAL